MFQMKRKNQKIKLTTKSGKKRRINYKLSSSLQNDIIVLNLLFHVNFAKEIVIFRQSRNTSSYIIY
jgi:hypothetical protein